MEQELFTLKDIALELDLPESTLRKYRDAYPEFIPTVGSGRERKYVREAGEVFKAIRKCRTEDHLSWEDTSEVLSQRFPMDTEAGAEERPKSLAERVPAAVETARTLKQMERTTEDQAFLLTTIGSELVKLTESVKKISVGMNDFGVIRRTILAQDNQIRNLGRLVSEALEEVAAQQEMAAHQPPPPAPEQPAPEPMPDREADDERRRDLYAVLDRLGQLQSSMSFVVKQFERRTLDIEKKYEQLAAAPPPDPAPPVSQAPTPAPPPAPVVDTARAEQVAQLEDEVRRLRAVLKERDEEISQLQGANRRLRIETDALKSRVSELSRIEPAEAPQPQQPMVRQPVPDYDKMTGGKLFFRANKGKGKK